MTEAPRTPNAMEKAEEIAAFGRAFALTLRAYAAANRLPYGQARSDALEEALRAYDAELAQAQSSGMIDAARYLAAAAG